MARNRSVRWLKIGAESVAIIASILLALTLDAWRDGVQDREEEAALLSALKAEAQSNLLAIETELAYRHAALESGTELLNVLSRKEVVDSGEMDRLLNSLVWWGQAQWSTGALNSLLQGGGLTLIQDNSLRSTVASLPESFDAVKTTELQDLETFRMVIMPFLYENTLVPQINNAQLGRPGTGDWQQPPVPVGEPQDHSQLIGNTRLIGIVTHKVWDQNDAINAYGNLQETIEQLMVAIDNRIGD